jgi:hypothetical protein
MYSCLERVDKTLLIETPRCEALAYVEVLTSRRAIVRPKKAVLRRKPARNPPVMRIRTRKAVLSAAGKCAQWADYEVLSSLRLTRRRKSGGIEAQGVVE